VREVPPPISPGRLTTADDYERCRARVIELAGAHHAETSSLLIALENYFTEEVSTEAEGVIRDMGLALVAAGQAAVWPRIFREHCAGRDPVGWDHPDPGDEWRFLFGDEWPKMVPAHLGTR
jgi:hypothetical protein